jgi:hypothetical protein
MLKNLLCRTVISVGQRGRLFTPSDGRGNIIIKIILSYVSLLGLKILPIVQETWNRALLW